MVSITYSIYSVLKLFSVPQCGTGTNIFLPEISIFVPSLYNTLEKLYQWIKFSAGLMQTYHVITWYNCWKFPYAFLPHRWFLLFFPVYVGATSVSSTLQLPTLLSSYDQVCFLFLTLFNFNSWLFAPPVLVSCNWYNIPNPISVSDVIPIFSVLFPLKSIFCLLVFHLTLPPNSLFTHYLLVLDWFLDSSLISPSFFRFPQVLLNPALRYYHLCCHLFSLFFIISNSILFQITFSFICPNSQCFYSVFPNLFLVHMLFPQETYAQPASIQLYVLCPTALSISATSFIFSHWVLSPFFCWFLTCILSSCYSNQ